MKFLIKVNILLLLLNVGLADRLYCQQDDLNVEEVKATAEPAKNVNCDSKNQTLLAGSVEACMDLCLKTPRCRGINFQSGLCNLQTATDRESQALSYLKLVAELVAAGKNSEAGRLLEYIHILAPYHHDVLMTYGEYLEKHTGNIVRADQFFLAALTMSPTSFQAIRNRRRTQPLVERLDSESLSHIDNKRNELAMIPALSEALRRVKKEAYVQHIYHTAAIDWNTLPQIRIPLETGLSGIDKSIMEHNEILGVDLALKYVNMTLVHRVGKITLKDILEIHRKVLGHIDPSNAGRFRIAQVFVNGHVPAAPSKIKFLMEAFLTWLNSAEAQKMHPIKYAALAHYKLLFIHPFIQGNGRTARMLMNFLLMQVGYPPVIIRKQDHEMYYEHCRSADKGDARPLIRFIAGCTEKTIDVYLWATKEHLPELTQIKREEGEGLPRERDTDKSQVEGEKNIH